MSFIKMDQFIPSNRDEDIRQSIARILREEFSDTGSAIKVIGREINAHPRAVKNWYFGQSAPNLSHFIRLTSITPALLTWFLETVGYQGLADQIVAERYTGADTTEDPRFRLYGITFDTRHLPGLLAVIKQLNYRQLWFYGEVHKGREVKATELSDFWGVGIATAKRDIAGLLNVNLITFRGDKRAGKYRIPY